VLYWAHQFILPHAMRLQQMTVEDYSDYQDGYQKYILRKPLSECKNEEERRGWLSAKSNHEDWMRFEAQILEKRDGDK
jgi:hypothetical protein